MLTARTQVPRRRWSLAALLVASLAAACAEPAPASEPEAFPQGIAGGKTDLLGRKLAGVADPYVADRGLREREPQLRADMRARREAAWATVFKVLEPVPLLGLAPGGAGHDALALPDDVPLVPRFHTWYGVDDFKRMFQALYDDLGPAGRRVREPFAPDAIAAAFEANADAIERASSWPLERYIREVQKLGACPSELSAAECDALLQRNLAGASSGIARILYGPATLEHALANYGTMMDCLGELDTLGLDAVPERDDDFTRCFDDEFPVDAILVKAQWERADFGRDLPVFDTDRDALTQRLAPGGDAAWGEQGDRRANPGPDDIYTIALRNGSVYRLAGLHIMTKELRHWQWTTLWWSDRPDEDFGADRPAAIREGLAPAFRHYKMCTTAFYTEDDPDPAARYPELPSLAAALAATGDGAPTWCSNPYLEHGRGNAGTNCIGCHQHGGAQVALDLDGDQALDAIDLERLVADDAHFPDHGRRQQREVFPADYLWSFHRVDDLVGVVAAEVAFRDQGDRQAVHPRVQAIVALPRDAAAGATTFAQRCARCHGADGDGSGFAPSLFERLPRFDDEAIVQTLLQGKGGMPAWGETLDDHQLADLLGSLRDRFGAPQ
ncbi:MAG: c-type cytochrome [Deltaproteobacteria bacterium]|nr:c-type cytochrome [Deltaproteobacteria bacterium]